jgi:hypothetical protein
MPLFEKLWAVAVAAVCVVLTLRAFLSWTAYTQVRRMNELYQKALRELEHEQIEQRS